MIGLQICGVVSGLLALFFAFVAALTHFKIKKLFSLIDESQYEAVMPFVEMQRKRVYVETLICIFLTIVTAVLALVNGII